MVFGKQGNKEIEVVLRSFKNSLDISFLTSIQVLDPAEADRELI